MANFKRKDVIKERDAAFAEAERRIRRAIESGAGALDLSGLGLIELPQSIGELNNVWWLDLSDNQLIALPESLRNLKSLTCLYVQKNKDLDLPEDLVAPQVVSGGAASKPSEILDYYFKVQRTNQQARTEATTRIQQTASPLCQSPLAAWSQWKTCSSKITILPCFLKGLEISRNYAL